MFNSKFLAAALCAAILVPGAAAARDQLQITGSSTVLPFATIVAESFGQNTSFKTPVVEGGGTGAGIAKFCEGVGEGFADIANASRPMKSSEKKACAANGVKDILEVKIGFDGVVFASERSMGPAIAFTPSNWYNALAKDVVIGGKLVPNPYSRWNQIDGNLPDQEILALIPGSKHGTREVFDQKVIQKGCGMFGADKLIKARDGKADACIALRTDGHVVEIDGDYTETLARLKANKNAIGVFGLSFYENNTNTLQVSSYQGVVPSQATVASGKYPVSRPLFMYVKKAHIGVIPGLMEYVRFFVSNDIAGPGGPLVAYGLVADPALAKTQAKVAN